MIKKLIAGVLVTVSLGIAIANSNSGKYALCARYLSQNKGDSYGFCTMKVRDNYCGTFDEELARQKSAGELGIDKETEYKECIDRQKDIEVNTLGTLEKIL